MVLAEADRFSLVADVIVTSDARWIVDEVSAVLSGPDDQVRAVTAGVGVLPAVRERKPELVILDLQIGNMGAMATCMDLHLEESAGRIEHIPVLFLLDRRADVFLARRAEAEGWVVKPINPVRLRKAIQTILAGGRYEDDTQRPTTVPATVAVATAPAATDE
jgi:DNA-binding response OmpR family regulator